MSEMTVERVEKLVSDGRKIQREQDQLQGQIEAKEKELETLKAKVKTDLDVEPEQITNAIEAVEAELHNESVKLGLIEGAAVKVPKLPKISKAKPEPPEPEVDLVAEAEAEAAAAAAGVPCDVSEEEDSSEKVAAAQEPEDDGLEDLEAALEGTDPEPVAEEPAAEDIVEVVAEREEEDAGLGTGDLFAGLEDAEDDDLFVSLD